MFMKCDEGITRPSFLAVVSRSMGR
jgi:hypothetical protein